MSEPRVCRECGRRLDRIMARHEEPDGPLVPEDALPFLKVAPLLVVFLVSVFVIHALA
jgi:hypothetical protein